MSRKSDLPQSRRHVMIYDEDWDFLLAHYGPDSPGKLGPGAAVRALIHAHVGRIKAQAARILDGAASSREQR